MQDKAPIIAVILGWGGVIPFVAAALAFHFGPPLAAIYALHAGTIYGAVIITFIGAVHWGLALTRGDGQIWYVWSVIPSLLMAVVLFVAPAFRPPLLLAGLALVWGVDFLATRKAVLPLWYMRLRHGLTAVAGASLLALCLGV